MTAREQSVDVLVVGGGVAGLCAAIAAHDQGASVILVEAADQLGGTASWSGGALWVPANHHLAAAGGNDSPEAALTYMRHCAEGLGDEALLSSYVEAGPAVIRFLEEHTPLRLEVGTMPDYQSNVDGGFYTPGLSRSLAPQVFNLNRLGDQRGLLRRSPHGSMPFGYQEFSRMNAVLHPERIDPQEYQRRLTAGDVGWGEALCGALLLGVLERDIPVRTLTRLFDAEPSGHGFAVELHSADSSREELQAGNLVLCCGGYEWNPELVAENFPGLAWQPATVPENLGTAWQLAVKLGARLGNRGMCWGWPGYTIPGEILPDGSPLVRTGLVERALPHLVLVDTHGRRFVDESLPYHTILKAMMERDSLGRFIHQPAFHVFDQQFRNHYAFGPVTPASPAPDWIHRADTLQELAAAMGIDSTGLSDTLARFNRDVREHGTDREYGRGTTAYGRFWGDPDNQPAPNLGSVESPPFYAVPVVPSTIGTCGGPVTDGNGRVMSESGSPIPGLYAAGNSSAAFSGPAYFGPGGTIGPAMIFGVLAARHAARRIPGARG